MNKWRDMIINTMMPEIHVKKTSSYIKFSDSLNHKRCQSMSVTRFSLVKVHSLFAEVFGLTGKRNVF